MDLDEMLKMLAVTIGICVIGVEICHLLYKRNGLPVAYVIGNCCLVLAGTCVMLSSVVLQASLSFSGDWIVVVLILPLGAVVAGSGLDALYRR